MNFGDLKSAAGLKKLNDYLAAKSYVAGYVPSPSDTTTFDAIGGKAPDSKTYPHAARWYRHIASYDAKDRKAFSGSASGGDKASKSAAKDDDVDLFGSDEEQEDADAQRVREERLKAYAEKKSKKPELIAKTSVLLDVKPWDDETDMNAMLEGVKTIHMDGLLWGASKFVPVGYGINKLQIMCVVEDAKVSIEELQEKIAEMGDYVQSCDVAAMNKI